MGDNPLITTALDAIRSRKQTDQALVVAITGINGSGKTYLTKALAAALLQQKHRVQTVHLDDFRKPLPVKRVWKEYYENGFDYPLLVHELLRPAHLGKNVQQTLSHSDAEGNSIDKLYVIDSNTIILLDGVFLFRPELARYVDYSIFLHMPYLEAARRASVSSRFRYDAATNYRYLKEFIPAQTSYLQQFPPQECSDLLIDNTDWKKPSLVLQKSA